MPMLAVMVSEWPSIRKGWLRSLSSRRQILAAFEISGRSNSPRMNAIALLARQGVDARESTDSSAR